MTNLASWRYLMPAIANKVEQEIAQIEQQVVRAGGGPVSPDDLAQMTHYVRRTVNDLLE